MEYIWTFGVAAWKVLEEMAPYLLLGFFAAGVLHVLVKKGFVERLLGGSGLWAVTKAALVGVPMPVCSCGVIPLAASLRAKGASKGATTSFLVSTPETGVDSILATYALLGPVFTVYRVVVAFVTGITAGVMVALFDHDETPTAEADMDQGACHDATKRAASSPCCKTAEQPEATDCCADRAAAPATASCCDAPVSQVSRWARFSEGMRFGFVTLPRDIARPLLVGIGIAAAISILVEQDFLTAYLDSGLLTMFLMMLIGIPVYVCSTASIPIAVGFLHAGISPGAALVFLIVGPATNAATVSVVWKMLGRRTLVVYLSSIAGTALAAGLSLDALYAYLNTQPVLPDLGHDHVMGSLLNTGAAALLLGLLLLSALPPGTVSLFRREVGPEPSKTKTCCSE